ncbi:hypothetical protein M3226_29780 [Neobacillus cucumis]|uniref:surface carbohydrate biosynthesis protein n=1 Tax=Neobacillus cucumis TaxID=1740721 RepID=UPI00203DE913|nr:surface carbohydrate biosynthesis protein [Neobacillus cucumis]MCM3729749.1 hypothetical protein [Neobacillus cucumis]
MKKFLYLPIEAKMRELDAKLLLAYYAIQQNYTVILGTHTPIFSHLHLFPKGIIFSKGTPFGDPRKQLMADAKEMGYTLVELDEEEGIFQNNVIYDRLGKDEAYINILEHVYCWGNKQKQMIENNFPEFKDKIHVTGHPRFDLLQSKFRPIYDEHVKDIKQKYGEYILVNTRFTQYNHFIRGLLPHEQYLKRLCELFINLVKELSLKYPHLNIVVRPHLHEGLEIYRQELANCKNVFIINEGNVVMWILASKAVIHNRCTTGVEAYLLDKPVAAYLPMNYEKELSFLPNALSYQAVHTNDIFNFIDSSVQGGMSKPKNLLLNYYEATDENYAHENIIRLLNTINLKQQNSFDESTVEALSNIKGEHTLITAEGIKAFFNNLNKIEKKNHQASVKVIAPDLFEINL